MARKKPLSEQVVVIAGGSYGLGRAIADGAKRRGATVAVGARTEEALDEAAVDLADRACQKTGLQPQPVPPIYEPEPFAAAVLRCSERPVRELPVGWGAQKLLWGQKLSPRAGDLILLRNGWRSQHTEELKPTDSPDNLFAPLAGDPGPRGRFGDRACATTAWTWLRLHRGLVGAGVGLGTIGLLA